TQMSGLPTPKRLQSPLSEWASTDLKWEVQLRRTRLSFLEAGSTTVSTSLNRSTRLLVFQSSTLRWRVRESSGTSCLIQPTTLGSQAARPYFAIRRCWWIRIRVPCVFLFVQLQPVSVVFARTTRGQALAITGRRSRSIRQLQTFSSCFHSPTTSLPVTD